MKLPKITFWKILFVVILSFGAVATVIRFWKGLGASTNLSDQFPWGLWVGFDCLCGIMLTAGGFTLMATVYIFNIESFKSIARPALLTAVLGYLLEISAVLFDLGRPYRVWHPLIMWNPRSPMFFVGWCVMLYTGIMALEFAPAVFEKLRLDKPLRLLKTVEAPLIILGVVVAVVHQSALGMFYVLVPGKLHPLWYSQLLPVLFFTSAGAAGIAMTLVESGLSSRHFNHALPKRVVFMLGRILLITVTVYAVIRFEDLWMNNAWKYAFQNTYEASLFWLEIGLAVIIPIVLLSIRSVRENPMRLYLVASLTVAGFVANRLNVSVTGMEHWAGVRYIPKWSEVAVTLSMISVGIVLFSYAVKYLPIFEEGHEHKLATS